MSASMKERTAVAWLLALALAGAMRVQGAEKPDGAAVYQRWCSHCHAAGRGNPGTESLQVKYKGERPAVLTERTDLSPQAIAVFVRQGVLSMAPFRKTEITDAELEALSAYAARNFKGR